MTIETKHAKFRWDASPAPPDAAFWRAFGARLMADLQEAFASHLVRVDTVALTAIEIHGNAVLGALALERDVDARGWRVRANAMRGAQEIGLWVKDPCGAEHPLQQLAGGEI